MSYTQADRGWAEWIAWELEEAGHRVLVQAWDFVPGSNWVHQMNEGVSRAARTIAVLSPDYLESVYGKPEWLAAWAADPSGAERKLLPVRVAECDRPSLLGQVISVDLFGVAEDQARLVLAGMVRGALTGRAKPDTRPAFPGAGRAVVSRPGFPGALPGARPGALPGLWNVPERNPNFTGRERELSRLAESMDVGSVVAVHSLHGMGGVGKTQLAIEYAHRHASDFDLVWWVRAEDPAGIPDQIAALAPKLGLTAGSDTAETAAAVYEVLRGMPRWLLVFDNVEHPDTVRSWTPSGSGGRVLVTTRRGGLKALGRVVDVDVFNRAEAVDLLTQRLPSLTAVEADRVAELLGDLPLALEQAAAYMDVTGTPAGVYIGLLETEPEAMLDRGEAAGHEHTVASVWRLSWQRLTVEQPAAVELLRLCAYMAPDAIPLDLFTSHADLLPPALAAAAGRALRFTEVVGALVAYSLLRRDGDTITVHRLVQASIRADETATHTDGIPHPLAAVITVLRACAPSAGHEGPKAWPRWRQLLPHVQAATDLDAVTTGISDPVKVSWLLNEAAVYQSAQGQYARAETLLRRVLTIDEQIYSPDHPAIATSLSNLATVLRDLGRAGEAEPLLRRALTIDKQAHHPTIATSLNNLGLVLQDLGRASEAEPMLRLALEIGEQIYSPDHPTIATSLSNLALTLKDLGRADEAEPLLRRALKINEQVCGPDHPAVALSLHNLGVILLSLGRAQAAEPLLRRALTIYELVHGPNHPAVAVSLSNLGVALEALGQAHAAVPLLRRALKIGEQILGPDHPSVVASLGNLVVVLWDLGLEAEAEPLTRRVMEMLPRRNQ